MKYLKTLGGIGFIFIFLNACHRQPNDFTIVAFQNGGLPLHFQFDEDRHTVYIEKNAEIYFSTINSGKSNSSKYDWLWNFGDGTEINAANSVQHAWTETGQYEVSLTIQNGNKSKEQSISVFVTGTAYKFHGVYSGITTNSSSCDTTVENMNLLLTSSDIYSDTLIIKNLANNVNHEIKILTDENTTVLLPVQEVAFKDGSQWEIYSGHLSFDAYHPAKITSSYCLFDDSNFLGTCNYLTANMELE